MAEAKNSAEAPVVSRTAHAQTRPADPSNPVPPGTPALPNVTYSGATEEGSSISQPPAALGPTPFDLGQIKRVQIGTRVVTETPMRVGNLDLLVPAVEQMPQLGVSVTRAAPTNVPDNLSTPTERQFFQVNLAQGAPIVLTIGEAKAWIERNEQTLRAAPLVINGKIYLPIFSLAPLVGAAPRLTSDGTLVLTPTVQSVEMFPVRDALAVTIKTSMPVPEDAFKVASTGGAQPRTWIDFSGFSMGFDAGNATAERIVAGAEGIAKGARAAQTGFFPDVTRVVVDLKRSQKVAVQRLPDPTVLALVFTESGQTVRTPSPPEPKEPGLNTPVAQQLTGWTIVVDAGHGGKDTGARGGKSFEKQHTLDLAHRLAKYLRARGATVLMTREDDRYITLQGRVDFANSRRADLFISVHINASVNKSARGTETFYYTAPSLPLAREIHKKFAPATGFPNRGVSSARFYVVRKTWMPSVLLECGFVSNSSEEAAMMTTVWRERTAQAVAQGVAQYAVTYGKAR